MKKSFKLDKKYKFYKQPKFFLVKGALIWPAIGQSPGAVGGCISKVKLDISSATHKQNFNEIHPFV